MRPPGLERPDRPRGNQPGQSQALGFPGRHLALHRFPNTLPPPTQKARPLRDGLLPPRYPLAGITRRCLWRASGALRPRPGAYFRIFDTTPAPTVRPPSRMAKRSFSSIAIGAISSTSNFRLSPGITISVPSGSFTVPVTSVVRK